MVVLVDCATTSMTARGAIETGKWREKLKKRQIKVISRSNGIIYTLQYRPVCSPVRHAPKKVAGRNVRRLEITQWCSRSLIYSSQKQAGASLSHKTKEAASNNEKPKINGPSGEPSCRSYRTPIADTQNTMPDSRKDDDYQSSTSPRSRIKHAICALFAASATRLKSFRNGAVSGVPLPSPLCPTYAWCWPIGKRPCCIACCGCDVGACPK